MSPYLNATARSDTLDQNTRTGKLTTAGPRWLTGVFDDVETSEVAVSEAFHPHSIAVRRSAERFENVLNAVELGPFVMGELDYNVRLVLDCPLVQGYHINMPTRGAISSATGRGDIHTPPGKAVLYPKDTGAVLRTVADTTFHTFALKIDARALENTLSGLLGHAPDREPIHFAVELDLTRGDGLHWWNLVTSVRKQWVGNTLLSNPIVSAPLCQSILAGLLLTANHQHSELLHEKPAPPLPATLCLAEDLILDRLAEPITIVEIAKQVGLTTRALQRGFLQHLGMTPTQYIRDRRLERAHNDLATSDPATTRVADVAARWGFPHLGRFAQNYRLKYGLPPNQTLRA
jgi:AraC-like DNA-binding protein